MMRRCRRFVVVMFMMLRNVWSSWGWRSPCRLPGRTRHCHRRPSCCTSNVAAAAAGKYGQRHYCIFQTAAAAPFDRRPGFALFFSTQQQDVEREHRQDEADFTTTRTTSRALDDTHNVNDDKEAMIYQELQRIATELREHDERYYAGGAPIVEDDVYDALAAREATICQQYPHLQSRYERASPLGKAATRYGGRVGTTVAAADTNDDVRQGAASTKTNKQTHLTRMLSLDNAHSTEQVMTWLARVRKRLLLQRSTGHDRLTPPLLPPTLSIRSEPKLDGVSLSVRYQHGQLVGAATRGDGRQGQDVTVAVRQGQLVPVKIPTTTTTSSLNGTSLEVRGEVVLPRSVFADLMRRRLRQQQQQQPDDAADADAVTSSFSNARNAASGILLRKEHNDDAVAWRARLKFYAYEIVTRTDDDDVDQSSSLFTADSMQLLHDWGFTIPTPTAITTLSLSPDSDAATWNVTAIAPMLDYFTKLEQHRARGNDVNDNRLLDDDIVAPTADGDTMTWGDYDMDGVVHKVVDHRLRTWLGNSNRAPRWAIAHKFRPVTAVTKIIGVDVQVGRTGRLTPVAVLEPVQLGNVTVQMATLHNFCHLRKLLLPRFDASTAAAAWRIPNGTVIVIRRAGDVIPQIVQRVGTDTADDEAALSNANVVWLSLAPPDRCPACGSPVVADEVNASSASGTTEERGPILRCGGPPLHCPPRAIGALVHAFSRDALDVTGLSDARVRQLHDANLLRQPSDVFDIFQDADKRVLVLALPKWGATSVENFGNVTQRIATDGVSLARFIYALGIRQAGRHTAEQLARVYGTADAFVQDLQQACDAHGEAETFARLREENELTKGLGPALIAALEEFSRAPHQVDSARTLAKRILIHDEWELPKSIVVEGSANGPLAGQSVVFTGSLPSMTRHQAQDEAVAMGAKSTPAAIRKSTDLVVAGARGGKKRRQAEDFGIKIISAEEFEAMVASFREAVAARGQL